MKTSRFTEEQVITALRTQESGQKTVEGVCRELGISQARRLRILEAENSRLKRLLSERTLELDALQDVLKKL
ncbi:MAG: transposase [Vampirovibrionales bacterium]|nr:transposase [Vampirovibrionales bacterium]